MNKINTKKKKTALIATLRKDTKVELFNEIKAWEHP